MSALAINGGTPIRSGPYPGWPAGDDRDVVAVAAVVRGGRWGGYPEPGPKATEFEERFAAYQGAEHGVLMANGSVTMEVALKALGIGWGDEVIVPALTFAATAYAPMVAGALPVFVDVTPATWTITAACSVLRVVLEVRPGRDVDTVVLGRRECPPMGHMRTVRQASASFECCRDSCFRLIGRHADVDVGPATPRLGRAEALERHVRVTSVPIDDVFFRSKAPVPEGCGPKRTYVATCILCHRNAHDLDLGGVRLDPQLPSFC